MIRLLELLIAVVLVAVLAVLVGLALPSHRHVQHTTSTNRPPAVVFDLLNGYMRFKDWTSLRNHDPKIELNLSGPDNGKGARVDYVSRNPDIGQGSWEIDGTEGHERIINTLTNIDYGDNKTMTFSIRRTGTTKRSVEITESYDVDYGFDLFGRYAGLYVTRSVGDDMKLTLNNLDVLLATIPNFDYTTVQIKLIDVPAENLLVAPTDAKRTDVAIQGAMETQIKWIHQVMEKNGLEANGPLRIITTDFGADSYKFDVALPVHKIGVAATPAGSIPPRIQVNVEGPVKYVQTKPVRAITADYLGYPAALPAIRNSMHAWSITHGEDVTDRPWEVYVRGIEGSFSDQGEFVLYWPVKSAPKGEQK